MALCYQPRKNNYVPSCKPLARNNLIQKYVPKFVVNDDVWFYGDKLHVTTTKSAKEVDSWIFETLRILGCQKPVVGVVGLDIEWLPNLNPDEDHPVATLQLCVDRRCLIFQLLHRVAMPLCLRGFLEDENLCFVGVGIGDDTKKLFLHHGLVISRTFDLNLLAFWEFGNPKFQMMGLKRPANEILGKQMAKPKNITLSKWDAEVLSFEQIRYAAIDAFVSSEIGRCFYELSRRRRMFSIV